jgi:Sodium/hydrogen exchanger family
MEGTWKQINAVATPLLAYTTASALGGSGFITAFTAGIVFGVVASDRGEDTTFLAEQSGELLNAVTFLLFGAVLLGPALGELDWRVGLYAVLSLTVVRVLPVALAMLGAGMHRVTVGFLGWFGPRGLASIVFVLVLVEQTQLPERPLMLTVVTWTVALSVFAHGLTAWAGANRYADWYAGPQHEATCDTGERARPRAAHTSLGPSTKTIGRPGPPTVGSGGRGRAHSTASPPAMQRASGGRATVSCRSFGEGYVTCRHPQRVIPPAPRTGHAPPGSSG